MKKYIHIKSPEYPETTLCGQDVDEVELTLDRNKITCKSCQEAMHQYD